MPSRPSSPRRGQRSRGKQVAAVDLVGARREFRVGEGAHRLAQHLEVVAEAKVEVAHGASPCRLAVRCRGAYIVRQSEDPSNADDATSRRPAEPVQFDPLVPQPAYGRVAAAIEQKILDRSLRPGDPLPTETDLAGQFGVNRSTVREALRRLESAGLVGRDSGAKRLRVTRPGHADTASRVSRALTLDEVTFIELWEAMLAVAPRTAALAAAHVARRGARRTRGGHRRRRGGARLRGRRGRRRDFFGTLASAPAATGS